MIRVLAVAVVLFAVAPTWAQNPSPATPEDDRWERSGKPRQVERLERLERLGPRYHGDGVHLRIFRSYFLPEGETASEPVVVIGGSARVDGHVEDDVVVIGGSLRFGPKAVVDGNVVTVGGEVTMEPGATVGGTIDEAVIPWPTVVFDPDWNLGGLWPGVALLGSALRLSFILAVSILLTLVAPGWIGRIAGRPAATSGLLGLATEILFVPALLVLIVMLVISIVGIPLLAAIPFLLTAFALLWVAGFTGVAVRLGRALRGRSMADIAVTDFLIGYLVIVAVTIAGHVLAFGMGWLSPMAWPVRSAGLMIEYVAWTIGLGAAVTSLFASPRVIPPPFPAPSGL